MSEKLFLGQILERDNVKYGERNLIVSPTGSGKTHFIMNVLRKKYKGRALMLVSTSSLKASIAYLKSTYTTQNRKNKKIDIKKDIYVMTYAEFGRRVKWDGDFIKKFKLILCDEIHSLFNYYFIGQSHNLGSAINHLFKGCKNKRVFFFTATTFLIDRFRDREHKELYNNVKVIDYNDNKDIVRAINHNKIEFSHFYEIKNVLAGLSKFKKSKKKGLIFNERIDGMGKIEDVLDELGYSYISLWSINNKKYPLSEEQIRVMRILIEEGVIPEGYDFIIINGALREGWNLIDPDVEAVILNTTNETDKIQARGRVRKDIDILIEKVKEDHTQPVEVRINTRIMNLNLLDEIVGKELTLADKEDISKKINVRRDSDGLLVKWDTIMKVIISKGYSVQNKRPRINGKQVTVSIISKNETNVQSKSKKVNKPHSKFLMTLDKIKFTEKNVNFLNRYMGKGKEVAFKHIASSYNEYVIKKKWTERKFADITYLIAKDETLYSKANYANYSKLYEEIDIVEVLTERSKYEDKATILLEELKVKREKEKNNYKDELLKYIAEHGGGALATQPESPHSENEQPSSKHSSLMTQPFVSKPVANVYKS